MINLLLFFKILISGARVAIDIEDLKKHTNYSGECEHGFFSILILGNSPDLILDWQNAY